MNEDYLWDKKGSDPEIEGLEGMLSAFRYQETEPPQLSTANIVAAQPKRWKFSLWFAVPAFAAIALLVGGIYLVRLQPLTNETAAGRTSQPVSVSQPESLTQRETVTQTQSASVTPTVKDVPHVQRASFVQRPVTKKALAAKDQPVKLTKEEKFAYSQLMLALSITSSKLRSVQDTIDRLENDKTPGKPNLK